MDKETKQHVLDKLRLSLRLDDTMDESLLDMYVVAADTYLRQAIGSDERMRDFYKQPSVRELYETALLALSSTYYMYRVSVETSELYTVEPISTSIIGQLRTAYDSERRRRDEASECEPHA